MSTPQPYDSTPSTHIRFEILGPVGIRVGEERIEIGSRKCRIALAMLIDAVCRPVAVDRFVDGLWSDDPPKRASDLVRFYIMRLRKIIPGGADCIRTRPGGYELVARPEEVDAGLLQLLIRRARQELAGQRFELARDMARRAVLLNRGPLLGDLGGVDFLAPTTLHLQEQLRMAEEIHIRATMALGDAPLAIPDLLRRIAGSPSDEGLSELLMECHLAAGNPLKAVMEYERIRACLASEFGVDPGPRLRGLHHRVIVGELNAGAT